MSEEELWLVLYVKYNFTWSKWKKINALYATLSSALKDNFSLILEPNFLPLLLNIPNTQLYQDRDKILLLLNEKSVLHSSYISQNYPPILKDIASPPVILFYRGNLDLCSATNLAVIGSRLITNYSKLIMQKVLPNILPSGVNVVSGLAFGVDAIAHVHSLKCLESKTIAVLGSGVDEKSIYPAEHNYLSQQILESGGLLISEFFPETKVLPYHFPQRNRLIVALSKVVWVVQAGMKSGTILTAKIARDTGKSLVVTPASILEESYFGNQQILQDGAWPLFKSEEILSLLGFPSAIIKNNSEDISTSIPLSEKFNLSANQELILKKIIGEISVDSLSASTKLASNIISSELTSLELLGLVENVGQNNWVLV